MKISNAILIHGPGRSGTTLLNSILALHHDLGWISGYINRYPNQLWLTYLNRLQSIPVFEKFNRGKRKYPRPAEAYNFWLHYIANFNDKDAIEIQKKDSVKTIKAIRKILFYSGKKRFITKITGNSRHQTIDAVFENPTIIWIDRDPKAVIMSYYKQKWNYKRNEKKFKNTPTKELLLEYFNLYKQFQIKKQQLDKFKIKTFFYEDLVDNKHLFFKEICKFSALEYSEAFQRLIEGWKVIEGTNSTYKKYISIDEERYLDELINSL